MDGAAEMRQSEEVSASGTAACIQRLSIAPMMQCTDKHFRYLARLVTRHTHLWTEMVVDQVRSISRAGRLEHPLEPPLRWELTCRGRRGVCAVLCESGQSVLNGGERVLGEAQPYEHPVTVQLGGCCPELLARAARRCEHLGYDEINLNVRVASLFPALHVDCRALRRGPSELTSSTRRRAGRLPEPQSGEPEVGGPRLRREAHAGAATRR